MTREERIRLLVVEDEPDQLELLCQVLACAGYECQRADGVASALEAIAREDYSLVLADYDLADGTGADLIGSGKLSASQVVYLSGRHLSELPEVAAKFRKPVDVRAFIAKLGELTHARPTRDSTASFPPNPAATPGVQLVLYTSGNQASRLAESRLREVLSRYAELGVSLSVIDLARDPQAAHPDDRVLFTPTLVRRAPLPRHWLVGDDMDENALHALLGLRGPSRSSPDPLGDAQDLRDLRVQPS